jgi:enoyl-CoA hydratase/carnithine racemase
MDTETETEKRMSQSSSLLKIAQDGDLFVLTMDRPDKRNSLNNQLIEEFIAFFERPPTEARAVVLHGRGDHFCAGLDLMEMLATRTNNTILEQRRSKAWYRAFDLIQFGEIPVISVLQGAVVGGGLELASATHARVAERSAFFQLPEGQRGIFVGGSGSVRIPRLIGAGRMVEMMLSARTYDADTGLQLGLAHYVVDNGTGLDFAMDLARRIATNAPTSNYAVINGIPRIADSGHAEGLFAESMVASMTGADAAQRITSFFEGRKAKGQPA